MQSLSTAATGMMAQQLNVEVISNNIANANTIGFKRQRAEFQDLLYDTITAPGAVSDTTGSIVPSGVQVGAGVKSGSVYRINEQGSLTNTNNPFDIAINGDGYFRILTAAGDAYTRAGNFQMSATGQLVTEQGNVVAPGIQVPDGYERIEINESGEVYAFLEAQPAPQNLGQIEIVRFPNASGLSAQGGNLFYETGASGAAIPGVAGELGYGSMIQRYVETSNVDSVTEITSLIQAQRAYEMNAKVITASDEMMSTAANVR